MSPNLLSLPTSIFPHIWDYCEAGDIVELASTCRLLYTEIQSCVLVIDADLERQTIPIFFSDQCHSVFLTRHAEDSTDIALFSRPRQEQNKVAGDRTLVGDCELIEDSYMDHILFRNDPSREYFLQTVEDINNNEPSVLTVRKQFMKSAVTPTMKAALVACYNLGLCKNHDLGRTDHLNKDDWSEFFMKLFIFAWECLPEASSLLHKGFEEFWCDGTDPAIISFFHKQIINFFEQTFEQKEPSHCVKRALSAEERQRALGVERKGTSDISIQNLFLKKELLWEKHEQRHFDEVEDNLCRNELVFLARIPLPPHATSMTLEASIITDCSTPLFVLFFQNQQNGMDDLLNPIEGKFTTVEKKIEGSFYMRLAFDVKREYESCFLYFLPGDATRMELIRLAAYGWFWWYEYNECFQDWMCYFVSACRMVDGERRFLDAVPYIVLRAGASALLQKEANQELCSACKERFFMKQLETTQEGLACLVHVCNVLLEPVLLDWAT